MPENPEIDQETIDFVERAVGIGTRLLRTALPSGLTREMMAQQFQVEGPALVYVKATGAQVRVRRQPGKTVHLNARLYVSAGLQIATRQDSVGIYIVILRRRVMGALSRGEVRLVLPPDCDLVADLEGSNLHLDGVHGRITIPGTA